LPAPRAAYIGGCVGTSNTEAGFRYSIPVFGTAAHSWVQSFVSETESYRRLQQLLGPATVYLIDTYDTLEGARIAVELGKPLWGVRLDSGNLADTSAQVRRILDQGGLQDARIMVSGDLNEYRILELVAGGAPVDSFGVGTDLSTSTDAPSLGSVYKLVEMEVQGIKRYTAKFSQEKQTLPGAKQIFRYPDHDVVGCSWECPACPPGASPCEALLRPVILGGKLVEPLPGVAQARERAAASLRKLPPICRSLYDLDHPYRVEYSPELLALYQNAKQSMRTATS